ncbi:MAG: hypothetical protein WDZ77_03040 [Candidatus Pacearchaeota archaeon]
MAQKLDEKALAYSLATISAAGMLILGIFGYAGIYSGAVGMMMQWHMYFRISPLWILLGMVEAAIWGFIAGYATAWVYNKFT